jgi:hypothetical protein
MTSERGSRGRWGLVATAALAAFVSGGARGDDPPPGAELASFLELREIDKPNRVALETATEWTPAADAVLVKVLQRLDAPGNLVAGWRAAARPVAAAGEAVVVADELLVVRGMATFVAPFKLPPELAERLGRATYDVVRLTDERGLVADVVTAAAPAAWPRWQAIEEPAAAFGLPLATAVAPRPADPPADAAAWPEASAAVLLAAPGVAWFPATPLGKFGMDYGLFDSVTDGKKIVRGDAAAFYALLAAVGRADAREVTAAAQPVDVLSLIDPGRKWLPEHRGDPVVIEGTALRATRVPIDEPFRRAEVGADHYWELYVFVETPLLDVDGRVQNSYPIVCCVRELSPGMPSGERINERVRVPGFAFKRYAYSFEAPREQDGTLVAETEQRQTTLVIGPRAVWSPPAEDAAARDFTMIAGIAAAVVLAAVLGLGILYGNWSMNRTIRQSREELPDRIELPGDSDDRD